MTNERAPLHTPLYLAVNTGDLKAVKQRLDAGDAMNQRDRHSGLTPLHLAAKLGHWDIIDCLLKAGADVDVLDKHKQTALYVAGIAKQSAVLWRLTRYQTLHVSLISGINQPICDYLQDTSLDDALEAGHIRAQVYARRGADINFKPTENAFTLLHLAVHNLDVDWVKELLAAGASPNAESRHGTAPIIAACSMETTDSNKVNRLNITWKLLAAGANPNTKSRDHSGQTPLHLAVEQGDADLVQLLIDFGADVNDNKATDKLTPLFSAVVNKQSEVIDTLLKKVDKHLYIVNGSLPDNTPIKWAQKYAPDIAIKLQEAANKPEYQAVLKQMEQECKERAAPLTSSQQEKTRVQFHPLFLAIMNQTLQSVDEVSELLAKQKQIYTVNFCPPCYLWGYWPETWREPLTHMGYTEPQDNRQFTRIHEAPLFAAVSVGNIQIVRILLEAGADVDQVSKGYKYQQTATALNIGPWNETALHLAARLGYIDIVKLLLQASANINMDKKRGITPLFLAGAYGHFDIVDLLQNVDTACIDLVAPIGCPLLALLKKQRLAKVWGKSEVRVRVISQPGANLNQCTTAGKNMLHYTAEAGHSESTMALLRRGVNVNQVDEKGMSPLLMLSSLFKRIWFQKFTAPLAIATLEVLLKHGAYIDQQDTNGNTLLHYAVEYGQVEAVTLLCAYGANINLFNETGDSPLFMLKGSFNITSIRNEYGINILKQLLNHGAHVNQQDAKGNTLLHYAAQEGSINAIIELCQHDANPNLYNHERNTPLHIAATQWYKEEIIRALLKYSTLDISLQDKEGNTIIDTLSKSEDSDDRKLLTLFETSKRRHEGLNTKLKL